MSFLSCGVFFLVVCKKQKVGKESPTGSESAACDKNANFALRSLQATAPAEATSTTTSEPPPSQRETVLRIQALKLSRRLALSKRAAAALIRPLLPHLPRTLFCVCVWRTHACALEVHCLSCCFHFSIFPLYCIEYAVYNFAYEFTTFDAHSSAV